MFFFSHSPVANGFGLLVNGVQRILIRNGAIHVGANIYSILVAVAAAAAGILGAVGGGIDVGYANRTFFICHRRRRQLPTVLLLLFLLLWHSRCNFPLVSLMLLLLLRLCASRMATATKQ